MASVVSKGLEKTCIIVLLACQFHPKMYNRYAGINHNQCLTNSPDFSPDLLHHNHEEADTLLILHSIDVATMDPFKEVRIRSP